MAEGVLFNVAEGIIGNLGSLAFKEIKLLWGLKDELEKLENTVSIINDVLLDAEEQQVESHAVRNWLGKLEDAMYEADNLLDDFSTEALRREVMAGDKTAKKGWMMQVRIFFSKSNQLAYHLKMGHKMKAIKERLDAIVAARDFHLKVLHVEARVMNKERDNTHSFVLAEAIFGRKDDKKAIIDRLVDFNVEENVSILPIVGIGGLGKTTLAQIIFNDEQFKKHFEPKMWVCVSDSFDVKNIVEKILESATKEKPKPGEMDSLVGKLKEKIDGKKYLLVLDDVWNEDDEKWCHLKEVLMGGARGSRILVTTRNESVARTIRQESIARIIGTVESYSLRGLDEDASWSLFKNKAFEKGQEPENSSIVALGKEILEKCLGVPLAIRTIGSVLHSKNPETEWLSFRNNELSKIAQTKNDILPTLRLSYDQLPSHLKHCFAYCSLFPKDYKIDISTLIKLWMAQGFVKPSDQNRCLEDVGNEYFMDLLWRSFFQEAEIDEFGNIIACKMHDLMHDLAISVTGLMTTALDAKERNIDEKTRHVSFAADCNAIFSTISTSLYKGSRIRTFLCYDGVCIKIDYDAIFSSFKLLRVLDLRYLYFVFDSRYPDFVPSSIGKLKHLRYLNLSKNKNIKKLPDSITRLQNLQTLSLIDCESLEELPRGIKRLVNLRHVEINGCKVLTYMPRGLGQLTKLQTLSKFVVHSGSSNSSDLQELNRLNKLRGKLAIRNVGHGKGVASECLAANLKEKQHLHSLKLQWKPEEDVNDSDIANDEASLKCFQPHQNLKELYLEEYEGSRLPSWLLSLTNLVRFELYECRKCQYLPPLSQLPSLKYLSLNTMDDMEYISDSNQFSSSSSAPVPFFPSLQEIRLTSCPNLKGWWRKRDSSVEVNSDSDNSVEITKHHLLPSFPRLSTLSIRNSPMLTSMPMFPHLEEELELMNASLKPLQQTMMVNMGESQSPMSIASTSHSSTPLSKLKSLYLTRIADLETLPEWLQNLTSLKFLHINCCDRLKSLSPCIQHLTALQHLALMDCRELEVANDEDRMQWQGLTSLLDLIFILLPKLVSLPLGLQHATTLQTLKLSHCKSLIAIPEWIHNCKSLQGIEVDRCLSLASLPEGMCKLTSLQRLKIEDCPILLQRCERDTGEDWAKIAHIPELDLW